MVERRLSPDATREELQKEVARLNKIVRSLMDRAERSTIVTDSDFSQFQTTVMLEDQVRRRTAELQDALRENDRITRRLRESETKFRGVVNQSLVGIATVEGERFGYTNGKFNEIFGYEAEEIRQLAPLDTVMAADRATVGEMLRARIRGEADGAESTFHGLRKDGTMIDIEWHSSAMDLDGKRLVVTIVRDISERTRAACEVNALQERLREQSERDALTGLHNRRYLDDSLPPELDRAGGKQYPVSVVMCDLDHFKAINDGHGHRAGDEVLRAFADVTRRHIRQSDMGCRYGGEEFLIVLPSMTEGHALQRAEELRLDASRLRVQWSGLQIPMTASFGVASFPRCGPDADALITAADDALYRAKAAGRNCVRS